MTLDPNDLKGIRKAHERFVAKREREIAMAKDHRLETKDKVELCKACGGTGKEPVAGKAGRYD